MISTISGRSLFSGGGATGTLGGGRRLSPRPGSGCSNGPFNKSALTTAASLCVLCKPIPRGNSMRRVKMHPFLVAHEVDSAMSTVPRHARPEEHAAPSFI